MRRFWQWALVAVVLGLLAIAATLGWIPVPLAIDAAMGTLALSGLLALLGLPWDLYFQARGVVTDQDESVARGVTVGAGDRTAARRLARRLLALCVGLHAGAAGLLALASALSGGRVGYAFAVFFLVATGLRPIEASYRHLAGRLFELRERARYPREDVLQWVGTVRALETAQRDHARELERVEASGRELLETLRTTDERLRAQDRALDLKLDRVLAELERTVDRMTEDRELVAGLRALARLLRTAQSP